MPFLILFLFQPILGNHLSSWRPIFMVCGFLLIHGDVISRMRRLSVSVRKITLSKFVFVEDVNSWGRATHKYHENWATVNSNDFIVYLWLSSVILGKEINHSLGLKCHQKVKGNKYCHTWLYLSRSFPLTCLSFLLLLSFSQSLSRRRLGSSFSALGNLLVIQALSKSHGMGLA